MRFNYLVYPQAREKLEDSGLLEKMTVVKNSENGLPYIGHAMDDEIIGAVKEMKEKGYFDTMSSEKKDEFRQSLQNTFQERDTMKWKVERYGKIIEEKGELEDFYLMTGWMASMVLAPNEIWDFKKVGFKSMEDFVGTFGATIWEENHSDFRDGYKWVSNQDGRIIKNKISGDSNLDLRISQTDITPDPTTDPVGSRVSYRPELDADRRGVAPYHSTEPSFLAGVLKWIDQERIPSKMLKNKGTPLIEYTQQSRHKIGTATECFGLDYFDPRLVLANFSEPMPILSENYETDKWAIYNMGTTGDSWVSVYVGPSKELILSYETGKGRKIKKTPAVTFKPADADNILKGIFFQSMNGLGRTVPRSLLSIVDYRFSEQMKRDISETK